MSAQLQSQSKDAGAGRSQGCGSSGPAGVDASPDLSRVVQRP